MSRRRYILADYEKIMTMRGEGKTYKEIGEVMGIKAEIVHWLTKRKDYLPVKLSEKAAAGQPAKPAKPQKQSKYFKHDPFYNF